MKGVQKHTEVCQYLQKVFAAPVVIVVSDQRSYPLGGVIMRNFVYYLPGKRLELTMKGQLFL